MSFTASIESDSETKKGNAQTIKGAQVKEIIVPLNLLIADGIRLR